MKQTKL